jgi:hypothetical protein
MRIKLVIAVGVLGLLAAACGKKTDATSANAAAADASPAAANAAADASQVTSIPGYTPDTGNAAAGSANSTP